MSLSPISNSYNDHSTRDLSTVFDYIPHDILRRIYSLFTDPRDIVHLGSTRKLVCQRLFLDGILWQSLLQKHFPDSFAKFQPAAETSLAIYKQLYQQRTEFVHKINTSGYFLQSLESDQQVNHMAVCENMLVSASKFAGTIKVWDLNTGKVLYTLAGHRAGISCIAVDNSKIIASSRNGLIKVWDLKKAKLLHTFNGHRSWVNGILASKNKIVSCSDDGTIMCRDLNGDQTRYHVLKGHKGAVNCIVIHGRNLISGSDDHKIVIWGPNPAITLKGHEGAIKCLAVHNDKLISGSADKTIKVWDPHDGRELHSLVGHTDSITCLKTYQNRIISGSHNGEVKIWDLTTGQLIQTYSHLNKVNCITVYKGWLISGSRDKTIKICDLNTGQELKPLQEHLNQVEGLIVLNDKFISCAGDRTIKIFNLKFPSILIDLGIPNEKECFEKLNCSSGHLSKVGICSSADLQALGLFDIPDLQYLKIFPEEKVENFAQLQIIPYERKKTVFALLGKLSTAAYRNSEKTTLSNQSNNADSNSWTLFQQKIDSYHIELETQCTAPNKIVNKFSSDSYATIVKEVNALIDEFRRLKCETQLAALHTYIHQKNISALWAQLRAQGTTSLSALLQKNITLQEAFYWFQWQGSL